MLDWDHVQVFLHVRRGGSIRGAAEVMGIHHATVSRRIARLEQQLGVRLFEKLPSGYKTTLAGEEIVPIAETIEQEALKLERRIYGRDQGLSGTLRLTLPPVLATEFLMPEIQKFCTLYPAISLEVVTSYEALNLTKRQADIAIRLSYGSPPEHLYGQKLVSVHRAVYVCRHVFPPEADESTDASFKWINKESDGPVPDWANNPRYKFCAHEFTVNDTSVQLAAVREGLGAAIVLCFIGDMDPDLRRLPPGTSQPYGDLWLLTHGDIRRTPRVRAFMQFMAETIRSKRLLFEGKHIYQSSGV